MSIEIVLKHSESQCSERVSVLIVDDDSGTYNEMLKVDIGITVEVNQAFDDTEALESVRDSIENGTPYQAVLIAAFMPFGETVISGETVAMRLRQIDYSGQVIVWNSDKPACTRIDKPDCLESIENVVEGILVFNSKVKPISFFRVYAKSY